MHRDSFAFHRDHIMRQLDELLHQWQWWAGAIIEDHVDVIDPQSGEVGWRVQLRI